MNYAQIIAFILNEAEQIFLLAQKLRASSGVTDAELRAAVASENQATRDSIDAFIASNPTQ